MRLSTLCYITGENFESLDIMSEEEFRVNEVAIIYHFGLNFIDRKTLLNCACLLLKHPAASSLELTTWETFMLTQVYLPSSSLFLAMSSLLIRCFNFIITFIARNSICWFKKSICHIPHYSLLLCNQLDTLILLFLPSWSTIITA